MNLENTPALRKALITNSIHILKDEISFDQFFKLEAFYYITKDGDDTKTLAIRSEDVWSRPNLMEAIWPLDTSTTASKLESFPQESNTAGTNDQPDCSYVSDTDDRNPHAEGTERQADGVLLSQGSGSANDIPTVQVKLEYLPHEANVEWINDPPDCSYMSETCDQNQHSKSAEPQADGVLLSQGFGSEIDTSTAQVKHESFLRESNATETTDQPGSSYMNDADYKNQLAEESELQGPTAATPTSLRTHMRMRTHTGEKPYQCNLCKNSFSTSSHLYAHIRIHTGQDRVECNICEKSFSRPSNLKTHMRIHTGEKPYQCNFCEKSFARSSHLKTHMPIHTGQDRVECNICEKSFSRPSYLKSHMRIHMAKPYRCNFCEMSFSASNNLKSHIRTHTGEKPFKCSFCLKSFTQLGGLQYHTRTTHTGEKPFQCNHCEKSFAASTNLKNHLRAHTGERPFQCSYCENSFTWSTSLKAHVRTHHTEEKPL